MKELKEREEPGAIQKATPTSLPAIMVTGASTGVGEVCALELARRGFSVFAGVRRAEDGLALEREGGPTLHWLLLDVTQPATIEAAAREVAG